MHFTALISLPEAAMTAAISLLLRRFVFCMAEASAKRVTGDEPQGTMGRVQTLARFSFPPSFARTFSSKERRLGTRQGRDPFVQLISWRTLGMRRKQNFEIVFGFKSDTAVLTFSFRFLSTPLPSISLSFFLFSWTLFRREEFLK